MDKIMVNTIKEEKMYLEKALRLIAGS